MISVDVTTPHSNVAGVIASDVITLQAGALLVIASEPVTTWKAPLEEAALVDVVT